MNKLFTKVAALTLGVAMAAGVGVALGAAKASEAKADSTYSVSVDADSTAGVRDAHWTSASQESFTFNDVTWATSITWAGSSTSFAGSNKTNIVHIGANNKVASQVRLSTSGISGTISSVTLNCCSYQGKHTVSISVGGTAYSFGTATSMNTPASDATSWSTLEGSLGDCTATGSSSGEIVILVNSGSGSRAVYIQSITVVYSASPTPVTQYDVIDSVENGSLSVSKVNEGATLNATITPNTGYMLPESVTVTMGGQPASATYSNGVVTLTNVTGNVEITGTCPQAPSPTHAGTENDPYTISDAQIAIDYSGTVSNVCVGGIISQIDSYDSTHKSITYWISADGTTTDQFEVYSGKGLNSADFSSKDDIVLGATVVVKGNIKKYNSIYEFDHSNYLVSYQAPSTGEPTISLSPSGLEFVMGDASQEVTVSNESFTADPVITVEGNPQFVSCQVSGNKVTVSPVAAGSETVTIKGTNGNESDTAALTVKVYAAHGHKADDPYTVADAKTALDAGEVAEKVYVSGIINKIDKIGDQGGITYWISDSGEGADFEVFYGNNIGNVPFETVDDIVVGASIVNYGNITIYKGTYEFGTGSYLVSYNAPTPAPTLESIAVSGEYKTQYAYQENFDDEGIVVTATYSDQSQQTVALTDVEFSGYDKSALGEQTITVTYQEKSTTFKVTVYYTATYKPGEGTPEDGEYVEYIENPDNYELVSFEQTGFVAPAGKQFKEWSQGTTGKSVVVNGNLNFTAVYEDIPAAGWSEELSALFESVLHGIVPTYADSVSELAYESYYNDFEMPYVETSAEAEAELEVLCAGWNYNEEGAFYYVFSEDGMGYARGWVYSDANGYSTTIAYQRVWTQAQAADMSQHLDGFVPVYNSLIEYIIWDSTNNVSNWDSEYNTYGFGTLGQYASSFVTAFGKIGLTASGTDSQSGATIYAVETTNGHVYAEAYESAYGTQTATYALMWYEADPIPTSLAVDASAAKVAYYVGDELDTTGVVVYILDENGQVISNDVAQYCEFDADLSAAGQVTVAVSLDLSETVTLEGSYQIEVSVPPAPVYTAEDFAHDLLEMVAPICNNYDGKKNNKTALRTVWDTMSLRYDSLSSEEKAKVIAASAKDDTELGRAMAFYDYACKKYGLTKFVENRTPHAIVLETNESNSIVPIIAIIAASVAAVTAIGVIVAYKRRKALYTK